jgi:hypothetical protein
MLARARACVCRPCPSRAPAHGHLAPACAQCAASTQAALCLRLLPRSAPRHQRPRHPRICSCPSRRRQPPDHSRPRCLECPTRPADSFLQQPPDHGMPHPNRRRSTGPGCASTPPSSAAPPLPRPPPRPRPPAWSSSSAPPSCASSAPTRPARRAPPPPPPSSPAPGTRWASRAPAGSPPPPPLPATSWSGSPRRRAGRRAPAAGRRRWRRPRESEEGRVWRPWRGLGARRRRRRRVRRGGVAGVGGAYAWGGGDAGAADVAGQGLLRSTHAVPASPPHLTRSRLAGTQLGRASCRLEWRG